MLMNHLYRVKGFNTLTSLIYDSKFDSKDSICIVVVVLDKR